MNQLTVFFRITQWCFVILVLLTLFACNEEQEQKQQNNKRVGTNVSSTASTGKNITYEKMDQLPAEKMLAKTAEGSSPKTAEGSSLKKAEGSSFQPTQDYSHTEFKVLDFSERSYKGVSSLGIVLSVPLASDSGFQHYLVLERRDGERVDGAWILSDNNKELFFKNIEPETEYLLTVYANLKAFNEQSLGQQFKKSLTTKIIEASVGFAHDGGILPLTHSKGLPVYSININKVDVEFHRIKNDKMQVFLRQWSGGKDGNYQLQKYAKQADFVYSARFDLPVEKNKRERAILPIDTIDELKPAGIYLAVMKVPGKYEYRKAVTYFIRSDIGVHVRRYPGTLDVYLRSLITAQSLKDVNVTLLDRKGLSVAQLKSNVDGKVHFQDNLKKAHLLLAQKNQQMSLVRLNSPALDLSEFNIGKRTQYHNEAFFYGPRDLYRPGERVDISLLLRDFDGRAIPNLPLKAVIKRTDGQVMERFTWHSEQSGYYHHEYQLSENARTGKWHIEVELPGESAKSSHSTRKWSFSVEDFLPERMKLTLMESPDGQYVKPQKTLIIPVDGQYLYGAPAAGNRLETQINTFIEQEAVKALPDYLFGLAEEKEARKSYSLKDTVLDASGKVNLEILSKWHTIKSPIAIRVTSSLFETGGRAVKRQAKYRLWPAKTLIGIRPHNDDPKANTLLKFDVVSADTTGQLYAAENLQVRLIKKRRDYYWIYNSSDEWEMDYSEKEYPVYHQTLSIKKEEGKALIELPVEWGLYRLEITDPLTKLMSSVEFNAGGSWYSNNQQNQIARPDKVNLILDKRSYVGGERAQLTVKSPFTGKGIILVENNEKLLWQQTIELVSNELVIEIPIKKDWNRHDIYVSAVIFNHPEKTLGAQKVGSSNASTSANSKQPIKRAVGLLHLPLDRSERKLGLTLETVEKSKPFTALPVKIKLDNKTALMDKNIRVTLAAVDVGVLNVSNFSTPDPFSWFFSQRRYSVDSLDLYGNIMDGRTGIMGRQRFGGDMDLSSAGNLQKAKVKIVSLFHQPVSFDAQGEAMITLDIPDFNGQLRLMVLAFGDTSYGHLEQNVTIAAPVVTQLSMPRFLAANDESQLTLDVHNLSEQKQVLNIKLSSEDVIEIINPVRKLALENKMKKTLHYTVKSKQLFGLSDVKLHISNETIEKKEDEIDFHRDWQLAVRPAYPAIIRNQQQILEKNESILIKIATDDLMADTLEGDMLLSNQPPINLPAHLKHLLKYPYGCLEQTTSSSFPWLFANKENIEKLGLNTIKVKNHSVDFSKRKEYLARGVQRLSAKQRSNGGFGLWSNQSSEEFWLTAYATHFLLQTRDQGIDVPQAVLKPAIKRLQKYLRSTRPGYDYRYSQYPEHLTLAYKSYAAYVLSSMLQAPLGTMRTLYDYHQKDAHSGLPILHLGIALSRQGDLKRGTEAIRRSLEIKRDANAYLGDYGSKLRDISLMLEALVKFQPSHSGINTLLYQLQEELGKRQWLSTQERNALFMAGVALKGSGQKQWQAIINAALPEQAETVQLSPQSVAKEIAKETEQKAEQKIIHEGDYKPNIDRRDIVEGVRLKSLSDGRLYASLDVSGYTKTPPEPKFDHFNITRTYYSSRGKVILPEQIAVGELLIVELSLQAKNRIQDALVIDLLPAGFEIENQNLSHSIKLDDYRIGQDAIIDKMSRNEIKYQAYRDDRYIAAIDLKGYGTQRLYYLLRAVTPGTYQVPPPYAEDMYRPYIRAIGETPEPQTVLRRNIQM